MVTDTAKDIKTLEKKVDSMFKALQRMERLLKTIEHKAARGVDASRRNTAEIHKLKQLVKQRE